MFESIEDWAPADVLRRYTLASDRLTPPPELAALLNDEMFVVRTAAFFNRATPIEALKAFMASSAEWESYRFDRHSMGEGYQELTFVWSAKDYRPPTRPALPATAKNRVVTTAADYVRSREDPEFQPALPTRPRINPAALLKPRVPPGPARAVLAPVRQPYQPGRPWPTKRPYSR
jgi:hypothetical protein